jgi:DNA-binding SARP family transcriptional activator
MHALQLRLLGRFAVATPTGEFVLQSLSARLLAYLALARGKPVARHRVAGTLWPDVPEERARANLSTVAWRLKGALAEQGIHKSIVTSIKDHLSLDVDKCNIDVERFLQTCLDPRNGTESIITIERAIEATSLYQGDLLEDWDEEWCLAEREALRRRHIGNLQALAESFEHRGRLDLALEFAQRAVDAQPLDESLQMIVVRLLMKTGRKASAYSHYHKFTNVVRAELGVDPDDRRLQELEGAADLRSSPHSAPPALNLDLILRPSRLPLVGRVPERRALSSVLDTVNSEGSASVMLLGEAGIGKSRLIDWIAEEWVARGGVTGRGACLEFNEPVPYQALFDALDGVTDARELAFATTNDDASRQFHHGYPLPNSTPIERGNQGRLPRHTLRLFSFLKEKIGAVSQRRPVMIVVEDLQWADSGTLDFLMYLTTHSVSMPLLIVMTSRPQGHGAARTRIRNLRRNCALVLNLAPLAEHETMRLVSQVMVNHETSHVFVSWLQGETEGNPLFVIETLRLLAQRGDLDLPRTDVLDPIVRGLLIPDGVRSVVDQRLAYLEPPELRIAKIASVLGRQFDDELLATVAGISLNTLSRYVGGLLRAGIFEREGAAYRFTHDKIRAVCYESLPLFARRSRHSRAAAALSQKCGVSPHSLAWHHACAEQWTLATASWLAAGDTSTAMYAYEESLQAYQQALACLLRDDSVTPRERAGKEFLLLSKCDEVLAVLGRPKQQHSIHRRMEAACHQVGSLQLTAALCVRKAWLAGHEADFASALQLGRRAWALAKSACDRTLQVKGLHVVAWQLTRLGRNKRALQTYQLALRLDGGAPTPTRAAILSERAMAFARSDNLAAAESSIVEARRVRHEIGEFDEGPASLAVEVYVLLWRTSERETMAVVRRAATHAGKTGDRVLAALVHSQTLRLDTLGGRFGHALRNLRIARVLSRRTGYRRTLASCWNEIANGIGRVMGSYDWAWICSERALRLSQELGTPLLSAVCLDSQAMILMELTKYDLALKKVEAALEIYATNNGSLGPSQESLGRRGAVHLLRGDIDGALRDLNEAAQGQRRSGYRVVLVDTLAYLAMAEAKAGDLEKALAASEEALRVLEEIEWTGYQPQRAFWHHYRILEMMGHEPRHYYLKRAVEFIDAQAATLSRAQARRLRTEVSLNRAILEEWAKVSAAGSRLEPVPVAASAAN